MSTLFDRTIAESYTELLKTASTSGVTSSLTVIEDGDATASALQLSTTTVKSSGNLEVAGPATLSSTLLVSGASTLTGNVSMGGNLEVAGNAVIQGTLTANGGTLTLGDADTDNVVFNADVNSHILPNTDNTYDLGSAAKSWRNLHLDGTATINNISVTGSQTVTATTQSTDKDTGALVLEGGLGVEKNANIGGNLGVTGTTSLTGNASLSGTLGVTGATNLSSTLGVAGDVSVNTNKFNVTAASGNTSVAGTLGVTGATTLSSTLAVTGNTTMSGNLTVSGDLAVNGTTTNINTTNLVVEDKNVVLADVTTPTNTTADGGGITLKGTTDKTLNWVNATGAWTSSEDFNLLSGKVYEINGASVLSATSLGSGVTGSSLTSVGTIGTGTWQGTIVAGQYGGTGVNNSGKTITLGGNLTTSGAFATTLTSTGATNVTLPTTGTLATLANSETFTNKTLTSPVISSIVNTGTLTLPTSTDTLVGRATTDTLTNKSINLANNTLTATSAQIATAVTDETGTGSLVFSNSPTLVTPTLGAAGATSLTLSTPLAPTSGGTGLNTASSAAAGKFLGVRPDGTAHEYKTLTQGTNVTITDVGGVVTISAAGGGGGGGGGGSASGAVAIYRYNATAGQTVFSGADASSPSSTLVYTPNYVNVFLNGVKLDDSDFTATNGTSVTLSTACVLNDDVDIVAFGAVPQLASPGLANYVVGTNSGGTSLEYKQLVAGTGVSIAQGTGSVTISASGASAISAPLAAFRYIASAGQTVFNGVDTNGNTLAFTPGFLYVFVNGVLLAPTLDYTTTSSTTITLVSGCSLSDFVDILAFGQVTTVGLTDSSVTTAKITDSAVTTAKLNDSSVTTAKLNDSSVTTAKLNDSSVTTAKIADGSVTSSKLAAGAAVPSQTGNAGLYLTTNGTTASWATSPTGFRNRIINGDMRIDQRNAGASVTPSNGAYTLDRWASFRSGGGVWTVQRSTTAPSTFTNSLAVTVTTQDSSIASTDYYLLQHILEGFNTSDFAWGTAGASSVTLSFWVRSSVTGTFGGCIGNGAGGRSYPFSYSISSANTWEKKTITISGDTSGTWATDNSGSLTINIDLGSGTSRQGTAGSWSASDLTTATGATQLISTNGATFYITGVQLEAGLTATDFERRPYGTELALCQRYYEQTGKDKNYSNFGVGYSYSSTASFILYALKTTKRTTPTIVTTGTASNYEILYGAASSVSCNSVPSINSTNSSPDVAFIETSVASGLTVGQAVFLRAGGTSSSFLGFSAEL